MSTHLINYCSSRGVKGRPQVPLANWWQGKFSNFPASLTGHYGTDTEWWIETHQAAQFCLSRYTLLCLAWAAPYFNAGQEYVAGFIRAPWSPMHYNCVLNGFLIWSTKMGRAGAFIIRACWCKPCLLRRLLLLVFKSFIPCDFHQVKFGYMRHCFIQK